MIVTQGNLIGIPAPGVYTNVSVVEVPAPMFKINGKSTLTQIIATFSLISNPPTLDVITIIGSSKIKHNGLSLIEQSDLKTSAVGNRVMVKPTQPPYVFSN